MKKRFFIFLSVLLVVVLLVSCGKKTDPTKPDPTGTEPTVTESTKPVAGNLNFVIPSIKKDNTARINDTEFDLLKGIKIYDDNFNDYTKDYTISVSGDVDFTKEGDYTVTYSVSGDKVPSRTRVISVVEPEFRGVADLRLSIGSGTNNVYNVATGISVNDPLLGLLRATSEYKDAEGNVIEYFKFYIDGEEVTGIDTSSQAIYEITYKFLLSGTERTATIAVVNEPVINGVTDTETVVKSNLLDLMAGITATRPVLDEETGEFKNEFIDKALIVIVNIEEYDPDALGEYILVYKVLDPTNPLEYLKDSEGNDVQAVRVVTVYTEVRIIGAQSQNITEGGTFYPETGVTAHDTLLGDITENIEIIGTVNTDEIGDYPITYRVEGSGGVIAEVTVIIKVSKKLEGHQTITIMAGDVMEVDPFHPNYSGKRQLLRQQKQRQVEELYNVTVKYVPYPDNAAWGPERQNAMIQASMTGDHLSDIYYHVTTDWIRNLSQNGAIAPIDKYRDGLGAQIHDSQYDAGFYNGKHYGFSTGVSTISQGLFFNVDLLEAAGIANPTQMFLDGNWTWSTFSTWVENAQASLGAMGTDGEYSTLGGALAYYAEHMVPLNGGQFIDAPAGAVRFAEPAAMQTYEYIYSIYEKGVFEKNRNYDAGSPEWKSGKVLVHPGDIWFVNADNRWGQLEFELGYVPYPMSDDYIAAGGEYRSPIYGGGTHMLSSGMTPDREELVFTVWMALQEWPDEAGLMLEFEQSLLDKFSNQIYVQALVQLYDKTYFELLNSIGISAYDANAFKGAFSSSLVANEYATRMAAIIPLYELALQQYNQGI